MPTRSPSRRAWPGRINTIMQTCFFAISGVLPRDEAIAQDQGRDRGHLRPERAASSSRRTSRPSTARSSNLHEVELPGDGDEHARAAADRAGATRPPFVQNVTAMMMAGRGDELPVSAMPVDGTYPVRHRTSGRSGTSRTRCRSWKPDICIQCGNCAMVCPHCGDSRALLRRVRAGTARPRVSRPRRSPAAASPTCGSRCRSRSRTAPAASSASRRARRAASKRRASAPSTWTPRRRSSSASAGTWSSSQRCRTTSRPASTRRSCAACST